MVIRNIFNNIINFNHANLRKIINYYNNPHLENVKKTVSQWERDMTGRVKGFFLTSYAFDRKCIHTGIKYCFQTQMNERKY